MSPNKQKAKGSGWERDSVEMLSNKINKSHWKRIPSSGAIGTLLGESLLTGDLTGSVPGFPKKFKAECKIGYSNKKDADAKSLTVHKEWLDKIKSEASLSFSYPILLCKFSNVKSGVKYFAVFDFDTFVEIMNYVSDLKNELDKLYDKLEGNKQ